MAYPEVTNTFVNGTTADATEVNQNFADVIDGVSDGTKDINVSAAVIGSTLSVTGGASFVSTLGVTGNLSVNTDKFTVSGATGNTVVAGTLSVTGNVSLTGTINSTGDFSVNTTKFTVSASTGNTVVAGTLSVTGTSTLSGTLEATGGLTVNTNKFTVAAATGNTVVAGTLNVTGASTVAALTASGALIASSTLASTGDLAVATNKFTVAAATGNVSVFGTLDVGNDIAVNTDKLTIDAATGNTLVAGTLDATGDLAVNTDKFTVAATTGNTVVAGTLNVTGVTTTAAISATSITASSTLAVTGTFTVNNTKFSVAAATGNTLVAGTLGVSGVGTFASIISDTLATHGLITCAGNLTVNTDKFFVNSAGTFIGAGTVSAHGAYSPRYEFYDGILQVYGTNQTRIMNLESSASVVFTNLENRGTSVGDKVYQRIRADGVADAYTNYSNQTADWTTGIDFTDTNAFVISASTVPGTNNAISFDLATQHATLPSLNTPAAGKFRPVFADENGTLAVSYTDLDTKDYGGTFNITLNGIASAIAGTAIYYRIGKMVVCSVPTMTGTSTNTVLVLDGIPAAIQPDAVRAINTVQCYNNGNPCAGLAVLKTTGEIEYNHMHDNGTDVDLSTTGWANSGTKGIAAHVLTWFIC